MNLQEDAENFVDGTSRQQRRVKENGNIPRIKKRHEITWAYDADGELGKLSLHRAYWGSER